MNTISDRLSALLLPLVLLCPGAVAQPQASGDGTAPPQLFSTGYIFQVLGSLALVFAGIFLVVFLLRRVNRVGGGAGAALRVLASASVGQRERVVLIEVGEEQLLVGVAPGNVRALHRLEQRVNAPGLDARGAGADFASVLRRASPSGNRPGAKA